MSGKNKGSSIIHQTSAVAPEETENENVFSLYPQLPVDDKIPQTEGSDTPGKTRKPRRLPHMNMPGIPKINVPNVNLPHMINIQSYIPNIRPPTFLKDIYTVPAVVGDQLNQEIHKVGTNINKLIDRGEIYLSKPPPMPEFDNCSIFSILFSMANYIFNLGSNMAAAYVLWFEPDSTWWFWLTVTLMVFPTIIVNGFSLYWYWQRHQSNKKEDHAPKRPRISKCWWILRITMHLLLVGPFFRYFDMLYYGIKSRKSKLQRVNIKGPYCPWPKQRKELKKQGEYYNLLLHEERDLSILELMYSFMQDAPQLVLQLYILARRPPENATELDYILTVLVQIFSSLTSLFTLSWSLTSYQRALRYAMLDKPNLSVGGIVTIFLWQTFTILARVIALALFATAYNLEVFGLLFAHWTLMTLWILAQRTNFCGTEDGKRRPCEEFFYNLVMGWVYVFTMINVKGSPTRWKFTAYYLLILVENSVIIIFWFLKPANGFHWYQLPAFIGTWVAFFVGLAFMLVYYKKYHPDLVDGKMPKKDEPAKLI